MSADERIAVARRVTDMCLLVRVVQNTGMTKLPLPEFQDGAHVQLRSCDYRDLLVMLIEARGWK